MNNTALIYDDLTLNWFSIMVMVACLAGMLVACILRKIQRGNLCEILAVFSLGIPLALILSRLQYYFLSGLNTEKDFGYILSGIRDGGFGHYGAILGALIAVILIGLIFKTSIGELADCIAVVGAGIIAVGRFATEFCGSELGFTVEKSAFTILNSPDGTGTLAVYRLDGMIETVIFAICLIFFLYAYISKNQKFSKGNVALIFFMLHGLNQVVMDSLCNKSLSLFNNDFIKCSQITGILSWLGIIIFIVIRIVRKKNFISQYWFIIAAFVPLVAEGVAMQYRTGNANYISGRIVMGVCMALIGVLSIVLLCLGDFILLENKKLSKDELVEKIESHNTAPAKVSAYCFGLINDTIDDGLEDDFDLPQTQNAIEDFRLQSQRQAENKRHAEVQRKTGTTARVQAEPVRSPALNSETEIYNSYSRYSQDDDMDYPMPDTCVITESKSNASGAGNNERSSAAHRVSQDDLDDLRRMFDDME